MSDLFAHTLPVLFAALLRMSAVAALCALAVMLLRAVLKKLGAPPGHRLPALGGGVVPHGLPLLL